MVPRANQMASFWAPEACTDKREELERLEQSGGTGSAWRVFSLSVCNCAVTPTMPAMTMRFVGTNITRSGGGNSIIQSSVMAQVNL